MPRYRSKRTHPVGIPGHGTIHPGEVFECRWSLDAWPDSYEPVPSGAAEALDRLGERLLSREAPLHQDPIAVGKGMVDFGQTLRDFSDRAQDIDAIDDAEAAPAPAPEEAPEAAPSPAQEHTCTEGCADCEDDESTSATGLPPWGAVRGLKHKAARAMLMSDHGADLSGVAFSWGALEDWYVAQTKGDTGEGV